MCPKGLADESEYVRDTSLKAGQRIVNLYADTAIELFLPQLEAGLFDDNWRIRHSSVQLLGDLLYRISGVTGKMSTEGKEDDNFGTSQSNQVIYPKGTMLSRLTCTMCFTENCLSGRSLCCLFIVIIWVRRGLKKTG